MSDELTEYQHAFLLIQLMAEEADGLQHGRANSDATSRNWLGLKKARQVIELRDSMIPHFIAKDIRKSKSGRGVVHYKITEEGVKHLTTLRQYPKFQIRGDVVNRLLAAARGLTIDAQKTTTANIHKATTAADLSEEILRAFEELRRERHGMTGLVPIFEIRAMVAERLGEDAARHERFDVEVNKLRLDNRVRMVPINDASRTTTEQLTDSIPGSNVTWFFLEAVS